MNALIDLANRVLSDVAGTFGRVWPFLAISIVAAAAVSTYVGTDRVSRLLARKPAQATGAAVLLATLTPFCSCGTMAVLLGMIATSAPWAPLVAFMVASPLTSPSELVLSAGLFGWPFALILFVGTIAIGLGAGLVAHRLDSAGWLEGQARINESDESCATGSCQIPQPVVSIGPGTASTAEFPPLHKRWKLDALAGELWTVGRKLALFFLGFTAIGYLAIEAIPTTWLTEYLGEGSVLALPLAALLGVPAYINTEASLPLVAALMDGGMGAGPAMAFLVTGAGTSIGAISGLFVIARRRVVGLVVGLLFAGALILGSLAELVL